MAHGVIRAAPPESLRERARLTLQYLKYLPRTFSLVRESSRAFAAGRIARTLSPAALPAARGRGGKMICCAVGAAGRRRRCTPSRLSVPAGVAGTGGRG